MVTYDARPSSFTQLTTITEWEYLHSSIGGSSAIDASIGSAMAPSLDTSGRNAVMADGVVAIKGQLWRCDAPVSTPIPAASAQNRIDRLVIRLTRGATTAPTIVQPVVITGTPSGSPVEPPLVQTPTGIWDIPVSSWTSTSAGGLTSLVDERHPVNDTWHDMRPLINAWVGTNSGFTPPQYRFSNDGNWVEVAGWIKNPTSANWQSIPFVTLPKAYRTPVFNGERWACTGVQSGFVACVQSWADGTMTIEFPINPLPAGTMIGINGRFAVSGPANLMIA